MVDLETGGIEPRALEVAVAGVAAFRPRRLRWGGLSLLAGAVAVLIGTLMLDAPHGPARVIVVVAGVGAVIAGVGQLGKAWRGEQFDALLWISIAWLTLMIVAAALADLLPLAESRDVSRTLTEPTLVRPNLLSRNPLGTDRQGLDILGGVIYGARISLVVGLGAVTIGIGVGSLLGTVAGYYGRATERLVGLLTDSLLAFPPLVFLLALAAVLDPSVRNVTLGLAVLGIPVYVRLARANTLVFTQREFIMAARAMGATDRRIIFREILPNIALPVISFGFITIAVIIVAEASLSFLGLGVQRPNPTWGNMIAAGQEDLRTDPHLVYAPGVVLFMTVFAFNRIGDYARRYLAPGQSQLE